MKITTNPFCVYARKMPDTRWVQIYRDKDAKDMICAFDPWRSDCPTRRNKWINLNCFRWRLVWL